MVRRFVIGRVLQKTAALAGLLLMVACFTWLVSMPRSRGLTSTTRSSSGRGSFSTVVLDPGHGGDDSGAVRGNVVEKNLTLDVAQRVNRLLEAQGIATLMTRNDDNFVSLVDRARITNRVPDSIFVSIHFNEGERPLTSGVETYYAEHQSAPLPTLISWIPFLGRGLSGSPNFKSQSLAGFIQQSLVTQTHSMDRGAKPQQFFVIRNVTQPAVLVEAGFLSNDDDLTKLGNADYREMLAVAITDGILRYRDAIEEQQTTLAVSLPVTKQPSSIPTEPAR